MSTFRYGANVQANGVRLHYLLYGQARAGRDPVIILPGITSPAVTWGFVGERFGREFETYVLDIRGRGLSQSGPALDYSLDAQAADLAELAAALKLPRYTVVGHSMGARIAVRAARSGLPGLARLVLVDPPVSGPGRRPYPAKLDWYVDSIRLSLAGCNAEKMRAFCPTWTEDQLKLRAEWLHTCDERAVRESFDGFHNDDIHSDLGRITVPVRLIAAGRGDVIRDEDVAEIQRLLPSASTTRVPEAGHMIPWDDEAGFYAAFEEFLGAPLGAAISKEKQHVGQ
ncbi:alpha/beta fold hydrolase [Bradyrhizobium sp. Pha-3]|uniref:alpha/beta fold hydrolase n=1 Tax=Bradyrhizobium sp. Pha-3 TaxID=208375 RepID=UPI0035D4E2C3